jgi:hypothetical protein
MRLFKSLLPCAVSLWLLVTVSASSWPAYSHDSQRSGLAGFAISPPPALLQRFSLAGVTDQPARCGPTILEDRVVVGEWQT